MDYVSVEIYRATLGNYLERVYNRNESFVVTRNGAPFVMLAPVPSATEPYDLITARAIRKQTSHLLGQVHFQSTNLLIVRCGKPTAILASASPGRNL